MVNKARKFVKWHYSGHNAYGELLSGVIEGSSVIFVKVKLRELGIEATTVEPCSKLSRMMLKKDNVRIDKKNLIMNKDAYDFFNDMLSSSNRNTKTKIKDKEIIVFIKQFLVLLQSGVPLLKSFDIIINSTNNKNFIIILYEIKSNIENGLSLSESFGAYPKVFDQLFINFLAIGENGGILEPLLIKYVEYKEKSITIKHKVKSAMMYPMIICIVAVFILGIVLGFVIPQFEEVFYSVGASLPIITVYVIRLSKIVSNYWWMLIVAVSIAIMMCNFLYKKRIRFRFFIDKYVLIVPIVGALIQKSLISRWCRVLSLLFVAGVPISSALTSIINVMNNYLYGVATLNIKNEVEAGNSLYKAMSLTGIFPDLVNQMVAVGEESGSLDNLLSSIADYYDNEVNVTIDMLLSLIEPVTIVCLGAVLGIIILAIYLPLFNLGNVVG